MAPRPFAVLVAAAAVFAAAGTRPARAAPTGPAAGRDASVAALDRLLERAWHRRGLQPPTAVDDARFLRRIWIDLAGVVPPAAEVSAFLADRAPGKRARAVDALLAGPRYADHFTDGWEKVLMGRRFAGPAVDRFAFRGWLRGELARNAPWTEIARALVTASGRNSLGGPRGPMAAAMAKSPSHEAEESEAHVNGAVNFLLRYAQAPTDLAGRVARVFLGVQIQCAQCHDHPSEHWKQEDFRSFAAVFARTMAVPLDEGKAMGIRRVEVRDVPFPSFGGPRMPDLRPIALAPPRALDGADLGRGPSRRQALADWMVAPGNPWFGRALVNRYWALLLGRGFVEPIDDFRRSNPIVAPEVLEGLTRDFLDHGADLRHLLRTICLSRAYQAPAGPAAARLARRGRDLLWTRFRLRPMPPEALLDSLLSATGLDALLSRLAGAQLERVMFQLRNGMVFLFDVDEESEQKDFEGTIPQALTLLNGSLVQAGSSALAGTALEKVLAAPGDQAARIGALYLRTLSRPPEADELFRWQEFLDAPRQPVAIERGEPRDPLDRLGQRARPHDPTAREQAFEDLFWALLNSSEFLFQH